MASIQLEGLNKAFGAHSVVQDVEISIPDGEFVALLGPSGCGKTTCLRMIAGLELPSSGRIWLGNVDITGKSPRERDIAMVFQNYALYPHMTIRENMSMGLRYRKVAKREIDKRVTAAATLLDLTAQLDRKPGALSGGQRQRVALGRAIVREPQALLMDEPLSNLDATLRNRMRVELKLMHQKTPTTTVYVTHDQVEAMTMADRIAVMAEGRLRQLDTPQKIFNEPKDVFVASFIGAPAINLLRGRVEQEQRDEVVVLGHRISLSANTAEALRGKQEVTVGVRPQAISLQPQEDALRLRGRVTVIEPIGADTHVHLDMDGGELVLVSEASRAPVPGAEVEVYVGRSNLHFFDVASGVTVAKGA